MIETAYLSRILQVYARPKSGPLSFWYEAPELNPEAFGVGREYFMRFRGKAGYQGPFDDAGVPLLDYRGNIGRQYNPVAIAQYGLARFNSWCRSNASADFNSWLANAEWLVDNLHPNDAGVPMWFHHFDWPYRQTLKAPWYSGLAQGQGLSMLVRAAITTDDPVFVEAAHAAFDSFERPVAEGGVIVTDRSGDVWIEEYIVNPASHILNGFIWALWGVYDYARWSRRPDALNLWTRCVGTLESRLDEFDTGWWSLYEAAAGSERMLASLYYHKLHIVQLDVMHRLTGSPLFARRAARFDEYLRNRTYRARAFAEKAYFKLRRY